MYSTAAGRAALSLLTCVVGRKAGLVVVGHVLGHAALPTGTVRPAQAFHDHFGLDPTVERHSAVVLFVLVPTVGLKSCRKVGG